MGERYGGNDLVETRDRVRRIETRLTNFIKQLGFAPTESARVRTEGLVGVTDDGKLIATNASVTLGDVFFAAQKYRLKGDVEVYVGNRLFGTLLSTRE